MDVLGFLVFMDLLTVALMLFTMASETTVPERDAVALMICVLLGVGMKALQRRLRR